MTLRVRMHAPGPGSHGVVRHARAVARLVRRCGAEVVGAEEDCDVVHTHFTDALWGPSIERAAERFADWAGGQGRPVVVTVHDVPQDDDRPDRRRRRSEGFGAVLASTSAAVVAYRHEAAAIRPLTSGPVWTIEPPLDRVTAPLAATARDGAGDRVTVGVLGFVFPGKGHLEILRAAHTAGVRSVVQLGTTSPGHRNLAEEIGREARRLGVALEVTGELSDEAMGRRIAGIDVPVWAAAGGSASGSLITWIAHRRRPIAVARPISAEVDAAHPGCLTLVQPSGLAGAISAAARGAPSTRLDRRPAWSPVGELHLRAYRSVVGT